RIPGIGDHEASRRRVQRAKRLCLLSGVHVSVVLIFAFWQLATANHSACFHPPHGSEGLDQALLNGMARSRSRPPCPHEASRFFASSKKAMTCSRVTDGNPSRKSSMESSASK